MVTWYKFAFDVNVKLTLYYFFFQYDLKPDPSLISVKNNLASLCEMRGSSKNGRMYNYQILYMLCNKLCFAFRISNHDLQAPNLVPRVLSYPPYGARGRE